MTDSPAKDHTNPAEEQAYHSEAHRVRVGGDSPYPTVNECVSAKAQTKWTYFLLGCAILLPWNVLINATPFFLSRLAGSHFYSTFSSYLSSVCTLTKLVCQFYCTITSKRSSPSHRIFASIIGMIFLVMSLCLSTFFRGTPSTFFAFALFNAAFTAVATGYLCTAVYAGAALLGASFLQIVFSGQAAIAVAVSVVQVASSVIALWDSSARRAVIEVMRVDDTGDLAEELAARIFFSVSIVFLFITLAAYTWLNEQPFYKSATSALERYRRVGVPDERTGLLADGRGISSIESNSRVDQVFGRNLMFMFSLAYVFTVTLAVFPAISARVRPVNPGVHPLLFTAVHFLVFNSGDLLGRYSCSFPRLVIWSGRKILAMSLLRTLFIPLFLLCNIDRPETSPLTHPIIRSVFFMVLILALGYTTGYVSTLALLAVSSLEHNPGLEGRREDVDVAATLGGSCMILGLALGALSSFGIQAMV